MSVGIPKRRFPNPNIETFRNRDLDAFRTLTAGYRDAQAKVERLRVRVLDDAVRLRVVHRLAWTDLAELSGIGRHTLRRWADDGYRPG